ncbi:ESX-1 secretion-associated protein [Mycolicibacterium porcinum]|nr:ESX-1 secretion-associated protein [Mycolicibacterium porcinum]
MSGYLRVDTAHLHELSVKQVRAAGDLVSATQLVEGAGASVRLTHGPISSSTAEAVEAALNARRAAGISIAEASQDLGDKLTDAARRYDRTDATTSAALSEAVR